MMIIDFAPFYTVQKRNLSLIVLREKTELSGDSDGHGVVMVGRRRVSKLS